MAPYSLKTRLYLEKQLFGFWISRHPLERYNLSAVARVKSRDLACHAGRNVTLVGLLITHKTVTTKNEELMRFMTFEDEHGLFETVMFPELFRQRAMIMDYAHPFLLRGEVVSEMGALSIILDDVTRLEAVKRLPALPGAVRDRALVGSGERS